jgi:hypothetical protein
VRPRARALRAPGISSLTISNPTLTDVNGRPIGDTNGDGIFDGPVYNAQIVMDELCPGLPPTTVGIDADPGSLDFNRMFTLAFGRFG